MVEQSLKGKVAIVTGGSRGIGAGIAKELASRGASVLITYVSSAKKAEEVVSAITSAGGKAASVQADASSQDAPKKVVDAVTSAFDGGIDIIVNNAGDGEDRGIEAITYDYFDKMIATNVRFPLFLVQACLPHLRKGTRIVNLSSILARTAWPNTHVYSVTKAAIESLTRSLAVELGQKYDLTVNAINPGPVKTDMWTNSNGNEDDIFKMQPAGRRLAQVDDIAPIVAFLCEEQSRWVTANVTCANGGWLFH